MYALGYRAHGKHVFIELGRNWHGFLGGDHASQPPHAPGDRGGRGSRAVSAALVGTYLAAGDLVAYLDADCEYHPKHLQLLAEVIGDADFAYARMERFIDGSPWDQVGDGTPAHGRIDGNMVLHRAELLIGANWRWGGDADWDLISRWLGFRARYEYVPQVTIRWHHSAGDI